MLENVINSVTSTLVLFSSIGIFVLTLNARYTQSTGRVREIYDSDPSGEKLGKELDMLVHRCKLLKWSFALLICSALSSSSFVLIYAVNQYINANTFVLSIPLIGSIIFIFCSMVFLFLDVLASFKATLIHIEKV